MQKIHNLHDLLIQELRTLLSAEQQWAAVLARMIEIPDEAPLKEVFRDLFNDASEHSLRLSRIATLLEFVPRPKKCRMMETLVAEVNDIVSSSLARPVRDAELICICRKATHLAIASYGSTRAFAELLDYGDVAELIEASEEDEVSAEDALALAASRVDVEAEALA